MTTYSSKTDASYWIKSFSYQNIQKEDFIRRHIGPTLQLTPRKRQRKSNKLSCQKISLVQSQVPIYYLLKGKQVSLFHKLNCAEEMWHFYTGSSMTIYVIQETTMELLALKLGDNSESGEMFQILVKRGTWFGAVVNDPSSYSLVGCTVCPAFTFEDFELANRKTLISMYPEHKAIIKKLTRSH